MKVKVKDVYALTGIYGKLFNTVSFDSYKDSVSFSKEVDTFDSELASINKVRDKITSSLSEKPTEKEIDNANRELEKFLDTEHDITPLKIKEKYVDVIKPTAAEARLLSELDLVIEA